ncbi:MAG: InlB B-repeat-containing protein, partial [Prevotella sp.]|nr:InlB B-repeat-containing protein [Prevotella sp.]
MKRFRTKLLLLFIGLLLGKNMNAQVSASLDEFSIKPGETKEVNVYLTNGDIDITDFEGYIALPKGFSFVAAYDNNSYAKMTGRETAGQALTAEIQTDGRLLFGIYQMTGTTGFSGKEGSVVAFTIKADENINLGSYTLKMDDGLAVTIEAVSYDTPCSSTITVYKLFDVNVSSNNTTWGNVTGGGKELMPNTSVTLTATPVEGYKFVNWTFGETELSKENPYTFNVNDDTNIVGNFAINQYTMTFVPGNGEENIVKTQDYGTELTAPDNLKREGYTFNGWDSEVPQTVPASDKTFTAQWTSTVYTITYTLDGGKTETENPTSYTIESKEITLNNPAKEGYTFMGW